MHHATRNSKREENEWNRSRISIFTQLFIHSMHFIAGICKTAPALPSVVGYKLAPNWFLVTLPILDIITIWIFYIVSEVVDSIICVHICKITSNVMIKFVILCRWSTYETKSLKSEYSTDRCIDVPQRHGINLKYSQLLVSGKQ